MRQPRAKAPRSIDWSDGKVRLLDGAMGTELRKHGCPAGVCIEKWALEHPHVVASIHREYAKSGAQIVYTCTFGANRARLGRYAMSDETAKINEKLVGIARKSASAGVLVAGDIGPTGIPCTLTDTFPFDKAVATFKEQIEYLVAGGVDILVVETMTHLHEAEAALTAAKKTCDLAVMVTMALSKRGTTAEGVKADEVCRKLQELGAVAIGCNCSPDPSEMVAIIAKMKRVAQVPLIAKPSAGIPTVKNGELVYPYFPQDFVKQCQKLIEAGATMIGGCCGTSPEHIALLNHSLAQARAEGN